MKQRCKAKSVLRLWHWRSDLVALTLSALCPDATVAMGPAADVSCRPSTSTRHPAHPGRIDGAFAYRNAQTAADAGQEKSQGIGIANLSTRDSEMEASYDEARG
jgi:hypothetical protein